MTEDTVFSYPGLQPNRDPSSMANYDKLFAEQDNAVGTSIENISENVRHLVYYMGGGEWAAIYDEATVDELNRLQDQLWQLAVAHKDRAARRAADRPARRAALSRIQRANTEAP